MYLWLPLKLCEKAKQILMVAQQVPDLCVKHPRSFLARITMQSATPQAAAVPVPGGNWDPGWPPAGTSPAASGPGPAGAAAASSKDAKPAKRVRKRELPEPDKTEQDMAHAEVVSEVRKLMAHRDRDLQMWRDTIEAINDHAQRLDAVEHQDMQYADQISMVAEHCQVLTKDTDANLRSQMETFAQESLRCIKALEDGAVRNLTDQQANFSRVLNDSKTLTERLDGQQKNTTRILEDSRTLTNQIDIKVIEIQNKLAEHEGKIRDVANGQGVRTQTVHHNMETPQRQQPQNSPQGTAADAMSGPPGFSAPSQPGNIGNAGQVPGSSQPRQSFLGGVAASQAAESAAHPAQQGTQPQSHAGVQGCQGPAPGPASLGQASGGVQGFPQGAAGSLHHPGVPQYRAPPGYADHANAGGPSGYPGQAPPGYGGPAGPGPHGAYHNQAPYGFPGGAMPMYPGGVGGVGGHGGMGSNPGGDQHLGGFGGIGGGQNGRADEAWPAKVGSSPVLKFDSKVFETKFAQESKNQYDGGNTGGEAWKALQ